MLFENGIIRIEVHCSDAGTGNPLPEKQVGAQTIFVATAGTEFSVTIKARGPSFGEDGRIAAFCYVGKSSKCGSKYLTAGKPYVIKGWNSDGKGRAFLLADIEFEPNAVQPNEHSRAPNELKVEIKRLHGMRTTRAPAQPQPPSGLQAALPKDNDKKFFHRPSLTCREGSPFQVNLDGQIYSQHTSLATLTAVFERADIADLRERAL